jgi:CheY-like chemotaxis protein
MGSVGASRGQKERAVKILVAEDNYANRVFLVRLLEKHGHQAIGAEDGEQALEELRKENFDLLLLDVQMPVMNGIELTKLIREGAYPEIEAELPIIAVTAHAMRGDRERFLSAGMSWYLSKPLDVGDLFDIMSCVQDARTN